MTTFFATLPGNRVAASSRNWKKFSANIESSGVERKNHLKSRATSVGELDSAFTNGTWRRSAACDAVAVTALWKAPVITATFSLVIRRSVSAWPLAGSPAESAKTSLSFAPPRFLRPPPSLSSGRSMSGRPLLISSTASSMPFFRSTPVGARAPVRG